MRPISEQEVVLAGDIAVDIFKKYNISEEDQDKLYNALATIGIWKIVNPKR